MRNTSLLAAVIFGLSFSAAAHASSYTISISGLDTGSLLVNSSGPGKDPNSVYLSGGGGTIDSKSVTLVGFTGTPSSAAPNIYPAGLGIAYDNELYPGNPFPADSGGGILFTDGSLLYVLFGNADGLLGANLSIVQTDDGQGVSLATNTDTITSALAPSAPSATPEPSSMVLLGTGLLGLAGTVRRKFAVQA